MGTVYRKTTKGIEEIQTRVHKLVPRWRSALILVDGQRSDDDLAKLIQVQARETLDALLEQGFIEQAPSPVPAPAAPPAAPLRPVVNFARVRSEAVRRLNDQAGPAAQDLAIRMERAPDLDALRPLLVNARGLIAHMRGTQAANDYIAALSAL